MLFHVTATHTEDNCPGYHPEQMPAVLEAAEKFEELGKQFNMKVRFLLNAAPEHVFYALLEADSVSSVGRLMLGGLPILSSYKVTVVQSLEETIAMGRAMQARAAGAS